MSATKEELIERYRYINVEHDTWWDFEVDEFIASAKEKGVHIERDDVFFTGFCSQGDGASFRGSVPDARTIVADMAAYPLLGASKLEPTLKITKGCTMYYHSGCMHVDLDDWLAVTAEEIVQNIATNDLTKAVAEADNWEAKAQTEIDNLLRECTQTLRGMADKLYKDLEALHDDLTTDERVWDTLVANNMTEGADDESDDSGTDSRDDLLGAGPVPAVDAGLLVCPDHNAN